MTQKLSRARTSWLWAALTSIYGHQFTSAFGDDPAGPAARTWAATLGYLSAEQLDLGLKTCALSCDEFAPSLPLFHARCLGIPTLHAVADDLRKRGGARMGFTIMVWDLIDGYAFSRADQRTADKMLRSAYDLARERAMRGVPIPAAAPPAAALTHDERLENARYDQLHFERLSQLGLGATAQNL